MFGCDAQACNCDQAVLNLAQQQGNSPLAVATRMS